MNLLNGFLKILSATAIAGSIAIATIPVFTGNALAASACSSFIPSLSTPVSAAFVSSTVVFRVSDTFVAGDVITFQSPSTSNIQINSFQIARTSGFATTAILANFGVGGGSFSFTIPADGFYSFSMIGSGTNTSFTAGHFTFLASCTSGATPNTNPTPNPNPTNQETIRQYQDIQSSVLRVFEGNSINRIGEAFVDLKALLGKRKTEEDVRLSKKSQKKVDSFLSDVNRAIDIDNLVTLEKSLQSNEDKLDKAETDLKKARIELEEDRELQKRLQATSLDDPENLPGLTISLRIGTGRRIKDLEAKIKQLESDTKALENKVERDEKTSKSERKRLKLPPRIHRIGNEVKGPVNLVRADDKQIQPVADPANNTIPEQTFALSPNGDGVNFLARFSRSDDPSHQSWISGGVSFLSDNSAANRDGYNAQIAIGTAWKLNETTAAAIEFNAVNGRYDIGATGSTNNYRGVGGTAGLAYKLTPEWTGQLIGFYNRAWVDTTLGTAKGSYSANIYGISARISGLFRAGDVLITPNAGVGYTWTSIGGFTDSAAVVVPGSQFGSGNISASVRAEKTLKGSDKVFSWTPFARIGVVHNFNQQNTFTFGPGITVTDSNTSGNLQIGVEVKFNNGAFLNISGNGSSAFDGGLTSLGGSARLGIRF